MENPITSSPTLKPLTPGPSSATAPAKSLPWPEGNVAGNRWCNAPLRITASLGLIPAALDWTTTSPWPGKGRGTSRTSRTSMPPYESNCTALDMKITPILSFSPGLEILERDVGEFAAKRGAIHRKASALEPFIHLDGVLTHALPDDINRDLKIRKRAADDAREDAHGLIPGEIISRKVDTLAGKAGVILQDANGDRSYIRDGNLRVGSSRRERGGIGPFRELLLYKIDVLHEGHRREDRCPHADFGDMFFDLVLAVEVRNARLFIRITDRGKDEMKAGCLSGVGCRDALPNLCLRSRKRRCHREKRGGSFQGSADRRSV